MASSTATWEMVEQVLPHSSRILLYGPPGTGKTSLAFADGSEPYSIQCHEETSVAEIVGHFVPVGDRFIWVDGPALAAWRLGKRLLIDEIDLASGPVLSMLRGICNDPSVARITIPDECLAGMDRAEILEMLKLGKVLKTLKPTAGFQVIATMNGIPSDLDEPLADRFPVKAYIPCPHPNAIASLPVDMRKMAKACTKEGVEDERRIGIRSWKAFAELREKVGEDVAALAIFDARAGDVMDAVKLARTEEKVPEPVIESAMPNYTSRSTADEARDAVSALADKIEDRVYPAAYYLRTGQRGRPPRAECSVHGKMTHRTAIVDEGGNLCCKRCDALAAPAGRWTKRERREGGWVSA